MNMRLIITVKIKAMIVVRVELEEIVVMLKTEMMIIRR